MGETVANQILEGLAIRMEFVSELSTQLDISPELNSESTGHLHGKTFCITGTLTRPRKQIVLLIKANGGKMVSSVSGNLDYLVAGASSGTKLENAKNLGVTILTEDELDRLLKSEKSAEEIPINTQKSLMDF